MNLGLVQLSTCGVLRDLDLGCCTEITDAGVRNLAGLSRLKALRLPGGRGQLTDAFLPSLRHLTELQKLTLYGDELTDAGLACLESLTALKTLTVHSKGCRHQRPVEFPTTPPKGHTVGTLLTVSSRMDKLRVTLLRYC